MIKGFVFIEDMLPKVKTAHFYLALSLIFCPLKKFGAETILGRALALCVADPGMIPANIPYGPQSNS